MSSRVMCGIFKMSCVFKDAIERTEHTKCWSIKIMQEFKVHPNVATLFENKSIKAKLKVQLLIRCWMQLINQLILIIMTLKHFDVFTISTKINNF